MNRWLAILLLALLTVETVDCNCYDNWSRCTPQTSSMTGIMWKSCPEYCQKCKGQPMGSCVRVYNKHCSGGYQCHCSGPVGRKSSNPLDIATCKLGL
ncbi:hypothetical protein TELCIR_01265 [Teladorsagia circumcincta]|uniref:Uncharacterized protein n=1 Tax=Teladorsagia circumcincta TaxID=45464 RepID=A0A2G9V2D3_TELCI|nr:hypothetical protein TELCIR_01265 [Teladorsagia circumcincta]